MKTIGMNTPLFPTVWNTANGKPAFAMTDSNMPLSLWETK